MESNCIKQHNNTPEYPDKINEWKAAGAAWREALLVTRRSQHVNFSKTLENIDKNLIDEEKNAGISSNIVRNYLGSTNDYKGHCDFAKTNCISIGLSSLPNNISNEKSQSKSTDELFYSSKPLLHNQLDREIISNKKDDTKNLEQMKLNEEAKKLNAKTRRNRFMKPTLSRDLQSSSSDQNDEKCEKTLLRKKAYSLPQSSKHLIISRAYGSVGSKPKRPLSVSPCRTFSQSSSSSLNEHLNIPTIDRRNSTHSTGSMTRCESCECKPNEDKTCNICLEKLRQKSDDNLSINDSQLNLADVSTCSQDESLASFSETDAHRIARLEEAGLAFERPTDVSNINEDLASLNSSDESKTGDNLQVLPPLESLDIYAESEEIEAQDADDEFECDCIACQNSQTCTIIPPENVPDINDIENEQILNDHTIEENNRLSNELRVLSFLSDDQRANDFLSSLFQNVIDQMISVYPHLMQHEIPPASPSILNSLHETKIVIEHTSAEETCSICLCIFESGEIVTDLPCKHLFHGFCIEAWLRKSASCPVCRLMLVG